MLKLLVKSYKNQFKSAIRNLWDAGHSFFVYMIVIPCIWLIDWKEYLLIYYACFVPLMVGLALSRMYPNEMSKTLLLCPMNMEERRDFIRTGYLFRCTLSLAIYVVVNSVLAFLGMLPFKYFVVIFIIEFLFVTAVNIYRVPKESTPYAMERKYDLPGNYEVWNVLMQFAGIISTIIFVTDVPDANAVYEAVDNSRVFDIVMMSCAIIIVFLLWLKIVKTYYKPVMEQAVSMEIPIKSDKKRK